MGLCYLQLASSGCLPRGYVFSGGNSGGGDQCYQCCLKETAGSLEVRLVLRSEVWRVSEGRLGGIGRIVDHWFWWPDLCEGAPV